MQVTQLTACDRWRKSGKCGKTNRGVNGSRIPEDTNEKRLSALKEIKMEREIGGE